MNRQPVIPDLALMPDIPIYPGCPMPDFKDPVTMQRIMRQQAREREKRYRPQVEALLAAKWLPDPVHEDLEPWQWAWRRPPRRPGSKGMRFASTQQAYNALMKQRAATPQDRNGS